MVSQFFISFASIESISSGPQFLKSHKHFCLPESNMSNHFFFEKAKIYTFKDVDCKKDHQERPYLNHLGKKLTIAFKTPLLAAIVVCWRIQEESKFEIIAWSFTTDNIHH